MAISNKEIIDEAHRHRPEELLQAAANSPRETRRSDLRRTVQALEDKNDPDQEAWYQSNLRFERDQKDYRSSRRRKLVAGVAAGLALLAAGPKAVEHLSQDATAGAEASAEQVADDRGRWASMHDFRQAGFENVSTLWQIAEIIGGNSDPRDLVAEIRELNQIDGEQLGLITPEQKLLLSESDKYDERLEAIGFELVEKEYGDGTSYLTIETSR